MHEKFLKNGKYNMEYNVELTDEFLECSEEIFDYITNTLKNNEASERLREKIMDNVLLLENSPKMYTEIDNTDRAERKYRRMIVNNYVILYTIDENEKIVYVAHMYYDGQNYMDGGLL